MSARNKGHHVTKLSQTIRRARGFTLIEVMITMAIVAILSSISLPFYTDYLRRGQVQEVFSNLVTLRVALEQYYQDERSYGPAGGACGIDLPDQADLNFVYDCTLAADGQSFLLTAEGKSGGMVSGLRYSINQIGARESHCSSCTWHFQSPQARWIARQP